MKKLKPDPRYFGISLCIFFTGAGLLILWKLLSGDWGPAKCVGSVLGFLWKAVSTIAAGLIIAYILLPAVEGIEKLLGKAFKKGTSSKAARFSSIAIVYLLLAGMLALSAVYIIPGLVRNIMDFAESVPGYLKSVEEWYAESIRGSKFLNSEYVQNAINKVVENTNADFNGRALSIVAGAAGFALRTVVWILKALLAIILSIYFMASRRSLKEGLINIMDARIGEKKTKAIRSFLRSVDWVFGRYISAKLLQMLIIFIVTQFVFIFLKVPYSTLMSGFIALTNMVPFIGPFIGLIPPVLVCLLQSPLKALWVFLAIEGVQLLDEYFVQPHLIGDKMGLSPFWVLVSVIVGGGLFGIVGIILSVPVVAVIKILVNQYIKGIEKDRDIEADSSVGNE